MAIVHPSIAIVPATGPKTLSATLDHHATSATETISLEFSALTRASTPIKGVDLWLLDLSKIAPDASAKFAAQLSVNEWERAQQFKKNRHHFLATRALLRQVLAHYTGMPAQELQIARSEDGKPFLSNAPHSLYFNLTHSGHFAALAVTRLGEVGIDIETVRKRSYLQIIERSFHPDEIKQLHACAETECEPLFYRLWTLKEAFFKALGTGISAGLDKAAFSFQDKAIAVNFSPELGVQQHEWQFHQEAIADKTLVAVAIHSAEPIQHQWFDGNALLAGE